MGKLCWIVTLFIILCIKLITYTLLIDILLDWIM